MNPLVRKEIRLLSPTFAVALVLAVLPLSLFHDKLHSDPYEWSLFPFCFGTMLLALTTFGREFSLKTFPLLLVQPLQRRQIWRVKTGLLAGAMVLVFTAWLVVCSKLPPWTSPNGFTSGRFMGETILAGAAAVVVSFAGGLWTTLLLRQFTGAFLFSIFVPTGLLVVTMRDSDGLTKALVILSLYAIAAIWWARRQYLMAEDAAWTGGNVTFTVWQPAAVREGSSERVRRYQAIRALCWKEIRLHEVTLAGMVGLFVLHLAVGVVRRHWHNDSNLFRLALDGFGLLWGVVPLLVAGASVAEERRFGTMDGLLCLPVSSRVQFAIKTGVAFIIGGLASGILFFLAEAITSGIGTGVGFLDMNHTPQGPYVFLNVVTIVFAALTLVALYASTLTRNIVQALVTAIGGAAVFIYIFSRLVAGQILYDGFGALQDYVIWPVLTVTVIALASGNFRRFPVGWRFWSRNFLGFGSALVFSVTLDVAIYNRLWEIFTPFEPAHGPARLKVSEPVKLQAELGSVSMILPDGRLWRDNITYLQNPYQVVPFTPVTNQFAQGSNWVSTASNFRETAAIRVDGTLWVSEKPFQFKDQKSRKLASSEPLALVRFGDETNWQSVVMPGAWSALLLKSDGTLWGWGTNLFLARQQLQRTVSATNSTGATNRFQIVEHWPGFRGFEPHRLGSSTNWTRLFLVDNNKVCLKDRGGLVWMVVQSSFQMAPWQELEPGLTTRLWPGPYDEKWRSLTLMENTGFQAWVQDDGTLWRSGIWNATARPVQIGQDTNWMAVASDNSKLVALKRDGSLWQWSIRASYVRTLVPATNAVTGAIGFTHQNNPIFPMLTNAPAPLSIHKDWIGITGTSAQNGVITLAADGSLCFWPDRNATMTSDGTLWYWEGRVPIIGQQAASSGRPLEYPLLGPTRREASLVENIFATEK